MSSHPLVSVLMTSYNTEKFIAQAIESILAQTYSNWELLIADDCSSDQTRKVIDQFKDTRIRTFHNEKNLHYLRTRNRLIAEVKGDYIALLDSDDTCEPNKLALQVDAFLQDATLALCGTLIRYMSKEGKQLDTLDKKPGSYEEIVHEIKKTSVFTGSSIMVKTSVWKEVGGYRDFFNTLGFEDYDLTSRIVEKYNAINILKPLYHYRQYNESSSRRDLLFNPFKQNGHLLIQHFIEERAQYSLDSLDRNDIPSIINFIVKKNEPYIIDPSLIYRELVWSNLHRKMNAQALKYAIKAIALSPFRWANFKTMILCLLILLGFLKNE